MSDSDLESFFQAYVEAALWSSTNDADEPLDALYWSSDIHPESLEKMKAECKDFLEANAEDIGSHFWQAGHDFWLTRNGHGAGFWDRSGRLYSREAEERLTEASKIWGSSDLYVGDDGKLHIQ